MLFPDASILELMADFISCKTSVGAKNILSWHLRVSLFVNTLTVSSVIMAMKF